MLKQTCGKHRFVGVGRVKRGMLQSGGTPRSTVQKEMQIVSCDAIGQSVSARRRGVAMKTVPLTKYLILGPRSIVEVGLPLCSHDNKTSKAFRSIATGATGVVFRTS